MVLAGAVSFDANPPKPIRQLESLAKATAHTKSFVTVEALSVYLQTEQWQMQDIQAGLAEADRGEFASEAEVEAVYQRYGA